MAREGREGSIEVITGVMFSGKSEELLRRVRRAMIARRTVQVFKSQLDDRYGGIQTDQLPRRPGDRGQAGVELA